MNKVKISFKKIIIKSLGKPLPISIAGIKFRNYEVKSLNNQFLNYDRIYCNINFDDQAPIFGQINNWDLGGNVKEGMAKKLENFLHQNPDIAITSFVVPDFMGNRKSINHKFLLSRSEYIDWVNFYSLLATKYKIEYALHGLYHFQNDVPFFQRYTEFAFKKEDEALENLCEGISVLQKIGWNVSGFRQPGWELSSEIDLPKIALKAGIKYIASNSYNAGFNIWGQENISNYYPSIINGIINFPQNIELDWPLDKIITKLNELIDMRAFISIKGHFVNDNIPNCLNDINLGKLQNIAEYLIKNVKEKISFVTLNKMSDILYNIR